jgi:hypothetical protein
MEGGRMKAIIGQLARFLTVVISLVTMALFGASAVWAQQKASDVNKQIVGVWKLVSDVNTGKDGVKKVGAAWGPNPLGKFIFTSNGHFANLNTRPDVPKFASGNRNQGTAEENKAAVQGALASFGTYSVSPDGKVLTMKIEGSSWPNWTGTEQKRDLTIKGDEMKYTLSASIGGTSELTYKRIK